MPNLLSLRLSFVLALAQSLLPSRHWARLQYFKLWEVNVVNTDYPLSKPPVQLFTRPMIMHIAICHISLSQSVGRMEHQQERLVQEVLRCQTGVGGGWLPHFLLVPNIQMISFHEMSPIVVSLDICSAVPCICNQWISYSALCEEKTGFRYFLGCEPQGNTDKGTI